MTPSAIALQYWKFSHHYARLPVQDREAFLSHIVDPELRKSHDPLQQRQLSRLLGRGRVAA